MKSISLFLIIIAAAVIPAGCSKKQSSAGRSFTAVCSFYPVYIIAKNVADGVPGISVKNMTPPFTGCLHDYSVTAEDMKHLEHADLFVTNGAGMESFLDKTAAKYPKLITVKLADGIECIIDEGKPNPHVWLSVSNAIVMTGNCVKAFIEADASNADTYRRNGERYIGKLSELKKEMDDALKPFGGKNIVTFHEAFPYFAKEYGLVIAAVVEHEPGVEPSAKEIAQTVLTVRKSKVKALFAEPQYPSSAAKTIAAETGSSIFTLDPAVTGDDALDAYIAIMRKNKETLIQALK
jgi:zinc transport system substrate-binding protein